MSKIWPLAVFALALFSAKAEKQVFTSAVERASATLTLSPHSAKGARVTLFTSQSAGRGDSFQLTPANEVDEHAYICYAQRRRLQPITPRTVYTNAAVRIDGAREADWFGFTYYLLPWFDMSGGLYAHESVEAGIASWLAAYPLYPERTFFFEFRYDPRADRTRVYLDGQYAGVAPTAGFPRRIEVEASAETAAAVTWAAAAAPSRFAMLPPLFPSRAGAAPRSLSLPCGEQELAGVSVRAWRAEESIDTGRAVLTTICRDLFSYGPCNRNAFRSGPEYFQWSVPRRWWHRAWVLCAQLGEGNDTIGATLTRFGPGNRGREARSSVRLAEAVSAGTAKAVGSVVAADGRTVPLYLVPLDLAVGEIPEIVNDRRLWNPIKPGEHTPLVRTIYGAKDYLDFELTGAGHWNGMHGIRSGIQVFGCTLEESPVGFEVVEHETGNVFADDEKPVTSLEVFATRAPVKGRVEIEIRDENGRLVRTDYEKFKLKEPGARERLDFDLEMDDPGWYELDFICRDAEGEVLFRHEAAFALLGEDDREALYDSPYAAWPQTGNWDPDPGSPWQRINEGFPALGRHLTNPNRTNVLALIKKAGFRKGWHAPVKREGEFPEVPYTFSALSQYCGRGRNCETPEQISNRLDAAVAEYRAFFERFPHCSTIQLFHEGGRRDRDLAPEIFGLREPLRGLYLAEKGPVSAYWATEYAKRMRREFPDKRIIFGNVGSTSDKVAKYARDGFDLNLVDALGSEVRGFRSIPELPADLESPGTLWALKETGRLFGMTNAAVDASNEYVFRPERRLKPGDPNLLFQTQNAVRDYLVSLCFGVKTISSGHVEDTNSGYYDTDWGAAGLCRAYPFSYPKRMYVAIATLTKVLDKVAAPRRIDTGANAVYAVEFTRERKTRDYAAAFWTAEYGAKLTVRYPRGTKLVSVDAFGRRTKLKCRDEGVELELSPLPVYLIATKSIESAAFAPQKGEAWAKSRPLARVTSETVKTDARAPVDIACERSRPGVFANAFREDEDGAYLEAAIDLSSPAPAPLVWEYEYVQFKTPVKVDRAAVKRLGLKVRGNGSFARIYLVFKGGKVVPVGRRGYVSFHGWQVMDIPLDGLKAPFIFPESEVKAWLSERADNFIGMVPEGREIEVEGVYVGSARQASDPLEMRPVTAPIAIGDLVAVDLPTFFDADSAETEEIMETYLWGWL